jgi:hypothetical protein
MAIFLRMTTLGLALALTAGCVMENTTPPRADGLPFHPATPQEMAERCGAAGLQHLVGQSWPQALAPRHSGARIYASGDPVTMDHRPDRLNIELSQDRRRVVAVRCG